MTADRLQQLLGPGTELRRIREGNSSENFEAVKADGTRLLVKIVHSPKRSAKIAHYAQLFGQLVAEPQTLSNGSTVFLMRWIDGRTKHPEDLSDAEIHSFVSAYREFSRKLNAPAPRSPLIHGDLNFANVLFHNGQVAGFLDFEMVKEGTAADDLLRGFAHRAERLPFWAASRRRRVLAAFAKVVALASLPRQEWIDAIERYRQRKEAKRREKSHLPLLTAIDLKIRARLFKKLRITANAVYAFGLGTARKTVSAADVDAAAIAGALGMGSLSPLAVGCASAVFKGRRADGTEWFVKAVGEDRQSEIDRAAALSHCDVAELPHLRMVALASPWVECRHALPENLTDAEARNLARAYLEMLSRFESLAPEKKALALPAHDYAAMADIVSRLPFPVPRLTLVHGDMQYRNVAFEKNGEGVAAFFDLDSVRLGFPPADLVYFITDRYRKNISRAARKRLEEILGIFIASTPWPREDWVKATKLQILAVAAKRLAARPLSLFARLDAWRKTKPLYSLQFAVCSLQL